MYFNYKDFHSIVLLALVDADYNVLDIGASGAGSDGGLFWRKRPLKKMAPVSTRRSRIISVASVLHGDSPAAPGVVSSRSTGNKS